MQNGKNRRPRSSEMRAYRDLHRTAKRAGSVARKARAEQAAELIVTREVAQPAIFAEAKQNLRAIGGNTMGLLAVPLVNRHEVRYIRNVLRHRGSDLSLDKAEAAVEGWMAGSLTPKIGKAMILGARPAETGIRYICVSLPGEEGGVIAKERDRFYDDFSVTPRDVYRAPRLILASTPDQQRAEAMAEAFDGMELFGTPYQLLKPEVIDPSK